MQAPSAFNEIFSPLTVQIPAVEEDNDTASDDDAVAALGNTFAERIFVPGLANVIVWDCAVTV